MLENGIDKIYPGTQGHINYDTYSAMGGLIGIGLIIVGVPLVCICVPVFLVGSILRGQPQRNM